MDQDFINWILAGFGGLMGFILRAVWSAVKELQDADKKLTDELNSIHILVVGDYVRHSDLVEMGHALNRIEEKLDKKADK